MHRISMPLLKKVVIERNTVLIILIAINFVDALHSPYYQQPYRNHRHHSHWPQSYNPFIYNYQLANRFHDPVLKASYPSEYYGYTFQPLSSMRPGNPLNNYPGLGLNSYYQYSKAAHADAISKSVRGLNPNAKAIVKLIDDPSDAGNFVSGTLYLEQLFNGVKITGIIQGLADGKHGFHIHQDVALGGNCLAAGPHFNPDGNAHGAPSSSIRHAGDLGNIISNGGVDTPTRINMFDSVITLGVGGSKNDVAGRTVVVHEGEDDLSDATTHGNAGVRLACGVIQVLNPNAGF